MTYHEALMYHKSTYNIITSIIILQCCPDAYIIILLRHVNRPKISCEIYGFENGILESGATSCPTKSLLRNL
jgi:hypothetical protein